MQGMVPPATIKRALVAEESDADTEDSESSSTPGKAGALSKEGKDALEEAMAQLALVVSGVCKKEGKSEQVGWRFLGFEESQNREESPWNVFSSWYAEFGEVKLDQFSEYTYLPLSC